MTSKEDKQAPMPSALMKYKEDGAADWGNMWDTFCVLAKDGGPPHRATKLYPQEDADTSSEGYNFVASEIARGVYEVSGLSATVDAKTPGWLKVHCTSGGMSKWLAEAIELENVHARCERKVLMLPLGDYFTLKGEIKNVITAVAKTTHYWQEHVQSEVKMVMDAEEKLDRWKKRVVGLFRRSQNLT